MSPSIYGNNHCVDPESSSHLQHHVTVLVDAFPITVTPMTLGTFEFTHTVRAFAMEANHITGVDTIVDNHL